MGKLNFANKEDEIADKNSVDTQGTFSKINLDLQQNFLLSNTIRWENSIKTQYALNNKNLDGSEDLSIGGIAGVKYYPNGEQSAENGYVFTTEVFYSLPNFKALNSTISVFYDVGRSYMADDITTDTSKTLQDFGIGYYGTYKEFFINSHLAHNIAHDASSEKRDNNMFLAQLGWIF